MSIETLSSPVFATNKRKKRSPKKNHDPHASIRYVIGMDWGFALQPLYDAGFNARIEWEDSRHYGPFDEKKIGLVTLLIDDQDKIINAYFR